MPCSSMRTSGRGIPEDLQKVIIMAANQGKWAGRLTEQMKSMLTAVDALREVRHADLHADPGGEGPCSGMPPRRRWWSG